jgi:hypothetical protein
MDAIINNIAAKWRECLSNAAELAKTDDYKAQASIHNFAEVFADICARLENSEEFADDYQDFTESPIIKKISEELLKVVDSDCGRI